MGIFYGYILQDYAIQRRTEKYGTITIITIKRYMDIIW